MNSVSLMGRLTADPELRTTANGVSVTAFSLAVDRHSKEKETDFIDIVAWRGTAEFICKYFTKGSLIAIQGSIQTRTYEDKNGNKRKAVEVLANSVYFCGGKKTEAEGQAKPSIDIGGPDEDDLPF